MRNGPNLFTPRATKVETPKREKNREREKEGDREKSKQLLLMRRSLLTRFSRGFGAAVVVVVVCCYEWLHFMALCGPQYHFQLIALRFASHFF